MHKQSQGQDSRYKVVTLNSDQNRHSTDGLTSRAAEGARSTPIHSSYSNREGLHNAPAQRVLQRSESYCFESLGTMNSAQVQTTPMRA